MPQDPLSEAIENLRGKIQAVTRTVDSQFISMYRDGAGHYRDDFSNVKESMGRIRGMILSRPWYRQISRDFDSILSREFQYPPATEGNVLDKMHRDTESAKTAFINYSGEVRSLLATIEYLHAHPQPTSSVPEPSLVPFVFTGPILAEIGDTVTNAFSQSDFDLLLHRHFDIVRSHIAPDAAFRTVVHQVLIHINQLGKLSTLIAVIAIERPFRPDVQALYTEYSRAHINETVRSQVDNALAS